MNLSIVARDWILSKTIITGFNPLPDEQCHDLDPVCLHQPKDNLSVEEHLGSPGADSEG